MPGSPADLSYVGLTLADRYRLEEPLAQGALSQVFKGQDSVLRRPVVVKIVPQAQSIIYQSALHATAALTHPAVIAVYDAIEQDGCLFVVQEYVQSRPFPAYLQTGLPVERATDLAAQMARAIAYAHAHGVRHGDLTPAAVLVDRRAVLRLNNFALPPDASYFESYAAALDTSGATEPLDDPASPYAADVRAIGLIFWQALSAPYRDSVPPSGAEDAQRAFRPDVDERARELVRRCVVRSHPQRITDAEELVVEVEALAKELARLRSPLAEETPAALRVAREMIQHEAPWSLEDTVGAGQPWANSGDLGGATAPAVFAASASASPAARRASFGAPTSPPRLTTPSRPAPPAFPGDASYLAARTEPSVQAQATGEGFPLVLAILLGGALFVVCFLIGFFILH